MHLSHRSDRLRPGHRPRSRRRALLTLLWGVGIVPLPAGAQMRVTGEAFRVEAPDAGRRAAPGAPRGSSDPYPVFSRESETALLVFGSELLVASRLVPSSSRWLPAAGLDPGGIRWAMDRTMVGSLSPEAAEASDRTVDASMVLPLALVLATGGGDRWAGVAGTGALYAEAMMISSGLTVLGKRVLDRPRPIAYLSDAQRGGVTPEDLSTTGRFGSMPSGHSSIAWTGASLAVTDHLLRRPDASPWEHAGVGVVAGVLAGATAALRVEAGAHFPTDVVAGSLIGAATGVAVPLLHRGPAGAPPVRAWAPALGGTLAGAVIGVLISTH